MAQLRPVIIHGQLLAPDQLPRVKELGRWCPSSWPMSTTGETSICATSGPERASRISPARSALELGDPLHLSPGRPGDPAGYAGDLWCAANRRTQSGVHLGLEEEIPVLDALRAVTHLRRLPVLSGRGLGAIAPGMAADFVILDRDPLTVPKEALREIQVMAACRGGEWVYHKKFPCDRSDPLQEPRRALVFPFKSLMLRKEFPMPGPAAKKNFPPAQ